MTKREQAATLLRLLTTKHIDITDEEYDLLGLDRYYVQENYTNRERVALICREAAEKLAELLVGEEN